MKQADVHIGSTYIVKVSGKLTRVRITRECNYGGWYGINLTTNREIRIRTAGRLRREVVPAGDGRLEQIRNLRTQGISYDEATRIIDPIKF